MRPVYFPDRDLGKRFGEILRSHGLKVERHHDHFAPDTPDEVWLEEVGKRGWIALTHDRRIRYKPNERDAVMRHRVGLLVIRRRRALSGSCTVVRGDSAAYRTFLVRHKPPFIGKVYRPSPADIKQRSDAPGRIELWYPR